MDNQQLSRRGFLALTAAAASGCARVGRTEPQGAAAAASRVIGANDTVRVGVIGCGGRGTTLLRELVHRQRAGERVQVAAVSEIYEPRKDRARQTANGVDVHHNWEDLVVRQDIDAVVIATPDHWHAPMAIAAMQSGKDVFCEKPMARYVDEARRFRDVAAETGRIVQIGTQHTSEGQWHTARELIRAGTLGQVVWSQGSYSRNSREGEWNYRMDRNASPDNLDWKAFLGGAPEREFDPERYFRWRKFWDYSGGIATDLHYHKLAPLLIALDAEFPERVSAAGGIYVHDDREVPDTFVMTAEYPEGHTVVLASSMANRQGLPAVIRGHEATLYLEGSRVRVTPETEYRREFQERHGQDHSFTVPAKSLPDHLDDWLNGVRTREKCVCSEELGYRAMVAIGMSVEAYRNGRTLSYDRRNEQVVVSPPREPHAQAATQA